MAAGYDLKPLFSPRSVAVIGATDVQGKIGNNVISNLIFGGFKGEIFSVNPNFQKVYGTETYSKITDIPQEVDLAVIVIPAKHVPQVFRECAEKKVKACVIITAGFSEVGEEGRKMQEEITRIAVENRIAVVGPNCMGIVNNSANLNTLMTRAIPAKGNISMVSQSGTVGIMLMAAMAKMGGGFSKFVSSGNEAVLKLEDFLEYFAKDPDTEVVAAFIEGTRDGRRFLRVTRELTRRKPLIVVKAGRTRAGASAARSHTASVVGSTQVFNAVAKQNNIVTCESAEELIDYTVAFSIGRFPRGRRIGIITPGGGWGVLAADACEEFGFEVSELPKRVIDTISEKAPPYWSHGNPIDLVATYNIELLTWCGEVLFENDTVDSVILQFFAGDLSTMIKNWKERGGISEEELEEVKRFYKGWMHRLAEGAAKLVEKYKKPVFCITRDTEFTEMLVSRGVPAYVDPRRAVKCLQKMLEYKERLNRNMEKT
ncbi:MAG: acetate--CoA ligase family protein [Candidatus Freyarchaeota archaeon]|nr:CoA-binding protein [Candidatus Freyarchaeota archaeon]